MGHAYQTKTPAQTSPEHGDNAFAANQLGETGVETGMDGGDNAFRAQTLGLGTEPAAPPPPDEASGPGGPFAALVRKFSPVLGEVLDVGLVGAVGPDVGAGIQDLIDKQLESVSLGSAVDGVIGDVSRGVTTLIGVATGDQACCTAMTGWLEGLSKLGDGWLAKGSAGELTAGVSRFQEEAASLQALLTVGVMGVLDLVSPIWKQFRSAYESLAAFDQAAASWLADALGLSLSDGGGLAALAASLFDTVVQGATVLVDMVTEALLSFPPVAMWASVADAVLDLVDGISWLKANWDDPDAVEKAPDALANNLTQGFVVGMLGVRDAFTSIVADVQAFGARVASAMTALPGVGPVAAAVSPILDAIRWVTDSPFWGDALTVVTTMGTFAVEVGVALGEVLGGLAMMAMAGNPAAALPILLSNAFQMLPDCYKAPILDVLVKLAMGAAVVCAAPFYLALPYGAVLLEAFRAGAQGVVDTVADRTVAEKATLLEMVGRIGPEGVFEFLQSASLGVVEGVVGELWGGLTGLFDLVLAGQSLALLGPKLGLALTKTVLGVSAGLTRAADAQFDRIREAEPQEDMESYIDDEAIQALLADIGGAVDEVFEVKPDLDGMLVVVPNLVEHLLAAFGSMASAATDLLLDTLLAGVGTMAAAGSVVGNWVGAAAVSVLLGGSTKLVSGVSKLAKGLSAVRMLYQGSGIALEAALTPIRVALAAVGPFLRGLGIGPLNVVLDLLEALVKRFDDLIAPLERRLRGKDKDEDEDGGDRDALVDKGSPEMKPLLEALDNIRPDDVADAVAKELVSDEAMASILERAKEKAEELIDYTIVNLIRGKSVLPEWYDPDESADANVRRYLVAKVAAMLTAEGGLEEGEETETDKDKDLPDEDEREDALREATPEVRAVIVTVERLSNADLGEAAEQALLIVGSPVEVNYDEARKLAVAVAGVAREDWAVDLVRRPSLPVGYDAAQTVVQNVLRLLVVRTAAALPGAFAMA